MTAPPRRAPSRSRPRTETKEARRRSVSPRVCRPGVFPTPRSCDATFDPLTLPRPSSPPIHRADVQLPGVREHVRGAGEVRAHQTHREGRLRRRVQRAQRRHRREGGDKKDRQRVRERGGRQAHAARDEATPPSEARERHSHRGRGQAQEVRQRLQRCLRHVRAHGHRPASDHPVKPTPERRPLPVLHIPATPRVEVRAQRERAAPRLETEQPALKRQLRLEDLRLWPGEDGEGD